MLKFSSLSAVLFIITFALIGAGCNSKWGVKGEGPVVTEQRSLAEFHSIESNVPAELVLRRGKKEAVVIEAQQNILDILETEVSNGRLEMKFKESVGGHEGIKVYITNPDFRELALSGSGTVRSENELKGDELLIKITGSGHADLQAKYKKVSASITGSGDIRLTGKGSYLDLWIAGSGNIRALEFDAEEAKVSVAGSGDVEVDVAEQLEVSISGSGDLRYKGRPVLKSSTNGSGSISSL